MEELKNELSSMYQTERKVILHEFSMYKYGRKVSYPFYLAFLKRIIDLRSEEYYDCWFAKNASDIDLDHLITKYKF